MPESNNHWENTNFEFLAKFNNRLATYAGSAEKNVYLDPNTSLIKAGQFQELLVKTLLDNHSFETNKLHSNDFLVRNLDQLKETERIPFTVINQLHVLRIGRNEAVHHGRKDGALENLKIVYELTLWYYKNYIPDQNNILLKFISPKMDNIKQVPDIKFEQAQIVKLRTIVEEDRKKSRQKEKDLEEIIEKLKLNDSEDKKLKKENEENEKNRHVLEIMHQTLLEERTNNKQKEEQLQEAIGKLKQNQSERNAKNRNILEAMQQTLLEERTNNKQKEEQLQEAIEKLKQNHIEKTNLHEKILENDKKRLKSELEFKNINQLLENTNTENKLKTEELISKEKIVRQLEAENKSKEIELEIEKKRTTFVQTQLAGLNEKIDQIIKLANDLAKHEITKKTIEKTKFEFLKLKIFFKNVLSFISTYPLIKKRLHWVLGGCLIIIILWVRSFFQLQTKFVSKNEGIFTESEQSSSIKNPDLFSDINKKLPVSQTTYSIISPVDAKQWIDKKVVVKMTVNSSSDRLSWAFTLNSLKNYRDPDNLQILIEKESAGKIYRDNGVSNLNEHIKESSVIQVTGVIEKYEDSKSKQVRFQIKVKDPNQIEILK